MNYVTLGSSPIFEDCAQVGSQDYKQRADFEVSIYLDQLKRAFPYSEKYGCRLEKKWFDHDFGQYLEVVMYFPENQEAIDYVNMVQDNQPFEWDEISKKKLKPFVCHLCFNDIKEIGFVANEYMLAFAKCRDFSVESLVWEKESKYLIITNHGHEAFMTFPVKPTKEPYKDISDEHLTIDQRLEYCSWCCIVDDFEDSLNIPMQVSYDFLSKCSESGWNKNERFFEWLFDRCANLIELYEKENGSLT